MDQKLIKIFESFHKNPGISTDDIEIEFRAKGFNLPVDYWDIQRFMHGGEGFVGDTYVRFYPLQRLMKLNTMFSVDEFTPGLIIFGSNGGGTAWVFDTREEIVQVGQIPFIPMDFKYLTSYGESISKILLGLHNGHQHEQEPGLIEKEIHEVMPVVFGGDPEEPSNKVAISVDEYAEYVVWWNRKYLTMN